MGTLGVAGDLGDGLVTGLDDPAAIAGGDGGGQVFFRQARLPERLLQGPLRPVGGPGPGGQDDLGHDVLVLVQDDHVGGGGPAVDAGKIAVLVHSRCSFLGGEALGKGV